MWPLPVQCFFAICVVMTNSRAVENFNKQKRNKEKKLSNHSFDTDTVDCCRRWTWTTFFAAYFFYCWSFSWSIESCWLHFYRTPWKLLLAVVLKLCKVSLIRYNSDSVWVYGLWETYKDFKVWIFNFCDFISNFQRFSCISWFIITKRKQVHHYKIKFFLSTERSFSVFHSIPRCLLSLTTWNIQTNWFFIQLKHFHFFFRKECEKL